MGVSREGVGGVLEGRKGAKTQRGLPHGEAVGEDVGQVDLYAWREELVDNFVGVGESAVALAVVDVYVEVFEGLQAKAGVSHFANAEQRIGFGLFPFDGDFPEPDYPVGYGFEDGGGDDAGVLALEGLELAAEGGDGDSRAIQAEHFFILRSFPVISGHLASTWMDRMRRIGVLIWMFVGWSEL